MFPASRSSTRRAHSPPSRSPAAMTRRLYARLIAAGRPVASSSTARSARPFPTRPDTLVVAGGDGTRRRSATSGSLILRAAPARPARRQRLLGRLLLAAAGLLDGRRATTHWSRTEGFARRFPRCASSPTASMRGTGGLDLGRVTAGIDLALALIAEDLGEDIARRTAQQLVVYHRRPGGQSQFSALLELGRPDGRFGALLGWARERLTAARRRSAGRPRRHEPAQLRPRLHRRTGYARQGGRAAEAGGGPRAGRGGVEPIDAIAARSASATPSACAAPSCAPSVSRPRHYAAARGLEAGGLGFVSGYLLGRSMPAAGSRR